MKPTPKALVIRTAGTNCDAEMCRGFELAGASVSLLHLDELAADPRKVDGFDLYGFPGGFSYGDDIASGRIFAAHIKQHLYPQLRAAAARGCPMIAACNGFQVLVQTGLLPGPTDGTWPLAPAPQETSLTHNSGARFIDRWVPVTFEPDSVCLWTKGLAEAIPAQHAADMSILPIAHGEGRFVTATPEILARLQASRQVAVRYNVDVNGSTDRIAGICDTSGRIFGLMPHPERYLEWLLHPGWTRLAPEIRTLQTPGMMMFRNAVAACQ